MHKKDESAASWMQSSQKKFFKKGAYNSGLTVVILVIVTLVNILAAQLPLDVRQIDISRSQIYELSEMTETLCDSLDTKVEIYVIKSLDEIDPRIESIVNKYDDLSEFIEIHYVDPVENPTFVGTYSTSTDSVMVRCPKTNRQRTISFTDIICYDAYTYYQSGEYVETEFDGEGQITSAIDYVVSNKNRKVYYTSGHNEQTFSTTISKMFNKSNLEVGTLNLMTEDIPEDCEMLIIYAPTQDFLPEEIRKVETYLNNGGAVNLIYCQKYTLLPEIDDFLAEYGLLAQVGYAGDTSRNYQETNYYMFPVLKASHPITSGISTSQNVLVLNSKGFLVDEECSDNLLVRPFMTTSENGTLSTPDGDTAVELVVGATVSRNNENGTEGKLVVIGSEMMINESIASYSNLANTEVFVNSVFWLIGESEGLAIPAKSLLVNSNIVSNIYVYTIPIIGIPLIILLVGIVIKLKRQKQ